MATVRNFGLFPYKDPIPTGENVQRRCFVGIDPEIEVGDHTRYPIGVSAREAMKWYWKVKKWRMKCEVTAQNLAPINVDVSFSNNSIFGAGQSVDFEATNERDLVCPKYTFYEAAPENVETLTFALFYRLGGTQGRSPYAVVKDGNTFYVNFYFQIFTFGLFATSSFADDLEEVLEITFDGYKIPVKVDASNAELLCEITPEEYWEYNPNDGLGPIYDKTTGRQLRAFPDSSASTSASVS